MIPDKWLQLGVSGAVLFVLLYFIYTWGKYLKSRNDIEKINIQKNNNSSTKIDKLCDKIDKLVEAFYASNKCVSDMSLDTSNKYDNIKDNQDKQYSLLQKVYEAVTEIKAGMVKEGDK
jgi:alpha-glucuronidase